MLTPRGSFARSLLDWYDAFRRDLPWRVPPGSPPHLRPDPYHVLVSELMLQQTQVATVIPYFHRFLARFPTAADLAAADEQDVLRLWQGLGYYSRARNLQKAARAIVAQHGGTVPGTVDDLLALPGVGRYTAGAIASLAFEQKAPILDGNVARVLCRLDKIPEDPRDPKTAVLLWARAEAILPDDRVGDFNSALMELGATVCTPKSPRCLTCPVQGFCEAFAAGIQDRIPPARKTKANPLLERWTFCVRRDDQWLIEQRPPTGRWAGMWQFVTVEAGGRKPSARTVRGATGVEVTNPLPIGEVAHGLTHRRYRFDVFVCEACGREAANDSDSDSESSRPRAWTTLARLSEFPLPRPHLKIAAMLAGER